MSTVVAPQASRPAPQTIEAASGLIGRFDRFIDCADRMVGRAPWLVVVAMHEVARNLYPADPFLPFDPSEPPARRIGRVLDRCSRLLETGDAIESYFASGVREVNAIAEGWGGDDSRRATETDTQKLYGALWDRFEPSVYLEEAGRILRERLAPGGLDLASLAGCAVLDQGCGSGRYALALAAAGAGRVIAVDLGAASIERAHEMAAAAKLNNIEFRVADVLDLPAPDGSIDFVFSNGVLHHTIDLRRGIGEILRVLRPGGRAFLYLYGDGGLFWHARKAMRPVMQRIPRPYAMAVLDMIGMPSQRFIFADNWYVPIERHISRGELEAMLAAVGFREFRKLVSGRATDLDGAHDHSLPDAEMLWGDGEHRYVLHKSN